MSIDWTKKRTVADVSAKVLADRVEQAKSQCRVRIVAVADETAQLNIAAAASAGLLTEEQKAAWGVALQWVSDMRAAWMPIAEDFDADIMADESWPAVPAGVAELGAAF